MLMTVVLRPFPTAPARPARSGWVCKGQKKREGKRAVSGPKPLSLCSTGTVVSSGGTLKVITTGGFSCKPPGSSSSRVDRRIPNYQRTRSYSSAITKLLELRCGLQPNMICSVVKHLFSTVRDRKFHSFRCKRILPDINGSPQATSFRVSPGQSADLKPNR